MSEAAKIIEKMPDNCPFCYSPVKHTPKFLQKNWYTCTNHKCGNSFGREELVKAAQCPNCNVWIKLEKEKLEYECPQCKRKLKLYPDGFMEGTVKINESPEITSNKVIIKSKQNIFSDHTAIHPGAGIEMLLVRGNNIRVLPPDEKFPLRVDGKPVEMDAELYYVRSVLPKSIPCGTGQPIEIFDQYQVSYKLQAAADLTLRISDPVLFFKWVGYQECEIGDLIDSLGNTKKLDQKLLTCFPDALVQAVQAAQRNTKKDMDMLSRVDVGNLLRECMTSGLYEIGLSCDNVVLVTFIVNPGEDLLMDRVERKIQWDTEPFTVHEKDNPVFYAKIVMHGEGRVHIRDRVKLRQTALGQTWARKDTLDVQAENMLSQEAARIVHAAFTDILQPMIDDTGVRLSSIDRFLNYMQNNIQTYLNNSDTLESMGLEITGLTLKIAKDGYQPCEALAARDGASSRMATVREEENLRKFMDGVHLEQAQDASGMRIRIKEIQANEAKQSYEHTKTVNGVDEQMKDDEKDSRIRDIGREADIESAKYKAEKEADERRQKDEDEQREREKKGELSDYDHGYEIWLRQRKLIRAGIDAARTDEIGDKEHELRLIGMDEEAARGSLLADEKAKAMVHEIMQKIQESDLELRKKLEAYAYLQKLTEQKDQAEIWEHTEKAKAEIQQLLKKIDLEDAKGQIELLEQAADKRAERVQKSLQAKYARDMELKRLLLSHDLDKMNHESEMLKLTAEMYAREEDRAERLELLEDNLRHIEEIEDKSTDRAEIQAELDKVRAICDYLKSDSAARAAQAASDQERLRKEAENGESRLEKVAGQVEELHKQIGEMLKEHGDEYKKGLDEVRGMIGAEARDQKFEDMFREMRHVIDLIRDRAQQVEKLNDAKPSPIVQHIYPSPANPGQKKD